MRAQKPGHNNVRPGVMVSDPPADPRGTGAAAPDRQHQEGSSEAVYFGALGIVLLLLIALLVALAVSRLADDDDALGRALSAAAPTHVILA